MGIPVNVTSVLISRIIDKETDYLHNNTIEITHDSLAFVVHTRRYIDKAVKFA